MYWIMGLLGLAIVVAPFVLDYANNMLALWTSIVVGIVILTVAGSNLFYGEKHYHNYR